MQVAILVLSALVAAVSGGVVVAPATTLVRAPAHDSAVIKFDRVGGNFAYSSVEAPAYAAVSPVIKTVPTPVAVSYQATPVVVPAPAPAPAVIPAPAAYAYAAPAAYPYAAPAAYPYAAPYSYAYAAPYYAYKK